ncbi:MAG: chromate efflux transporter [Chitinophagaceae bacterium]|nr:chromate efflux transporter [Chitinophagaceae bacterium]
MTTQDTQPQAALNSEIEIQKPVSFFYIFTTFLKAGCLGFGGFMSLISVVESIIVRKRKLLTPEEMLDGISLASLLPGPQAVNVVAYTGNKLKGPWGAVVAGVAVVLPSFLLMVMLSYLYGIYGNIPEVKRFFQGFVPAVVAVIISVAYRMAKQNVKGKIELFLVLLAIAGLIFIPRDYRLYVTFLLVLTFGLIGYFLFTDKKALANAPKIARIKFPYITTSLVLVMIATLAAGLYVPVEDPKSLFNLVKTFGGLSVMLFGGGYVIIPIIQHHVVEVFHWVTQTSFKDGIAFSQVMPGPILIAAAFIGFQVKGITGALLSTIAIFTPPAILMVAASKAMEFFKKSVIAKSVLRGIRCGVIGMIFFAAWELTKTTDYSSFAAFWPSLLIFGGTLVALIKFNVDVVYLIPAAGLVGFFLYP